VGYGELSYFNDIKALTKTTIEEMSFDQDSPIQGFC